ncbi:MAG: sensor histidine kinase, partial [Hyphomicrobiaceae bacterium]
VELFLIMLAPPPYSLLWYTHHLCGLATGTLLLVMLLSEATSLYSQAALSMTVPERDRTNRLMTLGTATAAIAHEVKQPLAAMVNNAGAGLRWLQREPADIERVKSILKSIQSDGLRAAEVVESVRSVFFKCRTESRRLNIAQLIQDTTALVAVELRANRIELRLFLEDDLPEIAGDRLQLQQVFLNLISNSTEIMARSEGGNRILTIRAHSQPPDHVSILIKDTGPGLDDGDREKIFDPFFTNKANGTGLGLAISRTIVEAHGGSIWAPPDQAGGAVLQLSLPVAKPGEEDVRYPDELHGVRHR